MRIAYADPPYPGMSHFYKDHPDYGGEVDHFDLVNKLEINYDAWVLHTASTTLAEVLAVCPEGVRIGSWVKTFAAFKKGVRLAYAWEPVIFKVGRKQAEGKQQGIVMRDWIAEPMTMRRGLTGAKPEVVVHWALRAVGAQPDDEFVDLFPGSGAVQRAWESYRGQIDFTKAAS